MQGEPTPLEIAAKPLTQAAVIQAWLVKALAARLGIEPAAINPGERFRHVGLDSAGATALIAELGALLGRELSPTIVWEHTTPAELSRYLAGETGGRDRATAVPRGETDAIALIGLSCRVPGAGDKEAFWRLLRAGVDAVTEIPRDRWDADGFHDADPCAPGKTIARRGGFLDCVDQFDPACFGISRPEAAQMDPQQRLMLELSWEALEDAGLPVRSLRGSRTGVFFGAMWSDYARLPGNATAGATEHTATGQDLSIVSARVSYTFGLEGPSLTVNTACSSSLTAVHLACQSLRAGESSLALAGGVSLMLAPHASVAMSKLGGLSPDGRSKTFDARANGYARGEGGGVVVLKPLHLALMDGDPVYCVIRGSAVNNDGFSNGLTAPSPEAQEAMLRDAYAAAGAPPESVHYVEAHGTGTALGDPVEARALGAVLGKGRAQERPLLLGSVKTNIGHLEAAAGVAGLIKVVLAMERRLIPPSLHFEAPNPRIPFDELRLAVATSAVAWPHPEEPPLAGVSSFGFGGTNCHVVVEGAGPSPTELRAHGEALAAPADGPAGRIAFAFSGNGSQWAGMGRDLLAREPVFRAAVARCDRALRGLVPWSLLEEMARGALRRIAGENAAQLTLLAVQVGLTELWRSWGVLPEAVVGHSVGEVAAAHAAGVLELEDAVRIVHHRSRLQERVAGRGAVATIDLPGDEVQRLLAGQEEHLSVAGRSAPRMTAISGTPSAVDALISRLSREGIACRRVSMGFAAHGPQMDSLKAELIEAIADLRPQRAGIPIASTVTGSFLDGQRWDAAYWASNLREPVLFADAFEALVQRGFDTFVEIGPHPVLTRPMEQGLACLGQQGRVLPSLSRDQGAWEGLLRTLRALGGSRRAPDARPELFVLSAHTRTGLGDAARSMMTWLDEHPEASLKSVAYTAAVRRSHHEHRLALTAGKRAELAEGLGAFLRGEPRRGLFSGSGPAGRTRRCVFVFSGQGSQWRGMGRRLLEEVPTFRAALAQCDSAIQEQVGWSVLERIARGDAPPHAATMDVIQPLLFAIQVALAATFRSLGVKPDAVVGHSMGEVAAAHVAGALTLEDATRIVCRRSRSLARIAGRGAMVLVELSEQDARGAIAGDEQRAAIAVVNGPRSTVLSGEPPAIDEIAARLSRQGVFCRRIDVDVASHSPAVDPLRDEIADALRGIAPHAAQVPFYSTVTGEPIDGRALCASYWIRNLRDPVRFWDAARRLMEDGFETFLELSPHPILTPAIEDGLRALGLTATVSGSLQRDKDDRVALLDAIGGLHAAGHPVDLSALHPDGGPCLRLPLYPFQRERCWIEEPDAPAARPVLHCATWRPEHWSASAEPARGGWIIVAGSRAAAQDLAGALTAAGEECSVLSAADSTALRALRARGVVYVAGADGASPCEEAEAACAEVSAIVKALAAEDRAEPPRVWIVTRGAQPVLPADAVSVAAASLWGLGRVIAAEHPALRCSIVDVGDWGRRDELTALTRVLLRGDPADRIGIRGGARYVERLAPLGPDAAPGRASRDALRAEGTYLITGGLGALGAAVGQWMAEQGAKHLVLVGRSAAGPDALAAILAMERAGARVIVAQADVADASQLSRVLTEIDRTCPPLLGVIHAAAHTDDALVVDMAGERLRAVLAPKVGGAWNLHCLTLGRPLDFFVLFSSVASSIGLWGQGSYAAASAFLDGLARHRRARGLAALSIGWSAWAGLGLATRRGGERAAEGLARHGVGSLSRGEALHALGELLRRPAPPHVLAAPIANAGGGRIGPERFTGRRGDGENHDGSSPCLPASLSRSESASRQRAALEAHVRAQVADVLGAAPAELPSRAPMRSLGMSSLMAMELRSRLEVSLGVSLSTTLLWQRPTIAELATHLASKLGIAAEAPDAAAPREAARGAASRFEQVLSQVEALSGGDVRRALAESG